MKAALRAARAVAVMTVFLLPLGCGGYKMAPVAGRVTLDGRPLADAEVSFYPTGVNNAPYASGRTDPEGNYRLETLQDGRAREGVVVGESRVSISLSRIGGVKKANPRELSAGTEVLPAKYNRDTTLSCVVPPDGKQGANFDLSSK